MPSMRFDAAAKSFRDAEDLGVVLIDEDVTSDDVRSLNTSALFSRTFRLEHSAPSLLFLPSSSAKLASPSSM